MLARSLLMQGSLDSSTVESRVDWFTLFESYTIHKLTVECGRGLALGMRLHNALLPGKATHLAGMHSGEVRDCVKKSTGLLFFV